MKVSVNRTHPLGIKPNGNRYFDETNPDFYDTRTLGLGTLSRLDDALLLHIFHSLDPETLAIAMRVSKIFYIWCSYDEFWKHHVIRELNGSGFDWFGKSWRHTFISNMRIKHQLPPLLKMRTFSVRWVYSDLLFQSHLCASAEMHPDWLRIDNIQRRSKLSLEMFENEFGRPNVPVVICDVVNQWPAFRQWRVDHLKAQYGNVKMRAEAMDATFQTYCAYADAIEEESPLYLFDKDFAEKCPALANDYSVPVYFQQDLFQVLGDQRPDYRWLILGPKRSGSTFHRDPNATSAWNATIFGRKKWILYPPEVTPPGVFPSKDGSEVTTPVSIYEWFLNFYAQTKSSSSSPIECITGPGDLIFVPSGHLNNLNLFDVWTRMVALDMQNLHKVYHFLQFKKDQISGLSRGQDRQTLGDTFRQALIQHRPHIQLEPEQDKKRSGSNLWNTLKESPKIFKLDFALDQ